MTPGIRLIASVATAMSLTVLVVYALRVSPADLTWLLFVLTGAAWLQVLVLGYAARKPPRIGSLTERTFVGFVIAVLGTLSCVIVTNTDQGRPWFDTQTASLLFRLSILAVLAIPACWLVLWFTGRLGQDDR